MQPEHVTLHTLHSVEDKQRGTLCVAEYGRDIPFPMQRIFYLYDLPVGVMRAQHAHREQDQFLICLSGSIELTTVRTRDKKNFILDTPTQGVHFPPMTWVSIKVLEASTVCLVISSGAYDESDYIRNFAAFEAALKA